MKRVLLVLLACGVCASAAAEPLERVRTIPQAGWSEGLDVSGGRIWHPYPHHLEESDLATGDLIATFTPPSDYSESVTWFDGTLYELSYATDGIYEATFAADSSLTWTLAGHMPEIHGWGITHDGESLIATGNGSPYLYFLDPATLTVTRTVTTPVDDLEDLAWDGRWLWASSFSLLHGSIVKLDPMTGDIAGLYELAEPSRCSQIDGIAIDAGLLYVTGKDCPWIEVYELPPD